MFKKKSREGRREGGLFVVCQQQKSFLSKKKKKKRMGIRRQIENDRMAARRYYNGRSSLRKFYVLRDSSVRGRVNKNDVESLVIIFSKNERETTTNTFFEIQSIVICLISFRITVVSNKLE